MAQYLTFRHRDRKERSGEWPRHPAVRSRPREAKVLTIISVPFIVVAVVLLAMDLL